MVKVLAHADLSHLKKTIVRIAWFGAAAFILWMPKNLAAQTHMQSNNPNLPNYSYSTEQEKEIANANLRDAERLDSLRVAHMQKKAQDTVNEFRNKVDSVHQHAGNALSTAKKMIDMYKKSGGTFSNDKEETALRHALFRDIRAGKVDPRSSRGFIIVQGDEAYGGKYYLFTQQDVASSFGISMNLVNAVGY
jgi:hypothetical protein